MRARTGPGAVARRPATWTTREGGQSPSGTCGADCLFGSATGEARWTLQLIADRLVEMNLVEKIC